jgi:hypothetical protein
MVGADAVRPNVLRGAVSPNTLGGLTQPSASRARQSMTGVVLALAVACFVLVGLLVLAGR